MQALDDVEPTAGLYMPISQAWHELDPMLSTKNPAEQSRHALCDAEPVSGLYLPAVQLSHTIDPAPSTYRPTPHGAHVPSEWKLPAGQSSQLREAVDGHETAQASCAVARAPPESMPVAHAALHAVGPGPLLALANSPQLYEMFVSL